ncbi:hypothetical protein CtCNB1_2062 [Comamonas thiooxydans]|nr:hypothetical protein CtCNB1_2062 [Comamonas thiooxydans]
MRERTALRSACKLFFRRYEPGQVRGCRSQHWRAPRSAAPSYPNGIAARCLSRRMKVASLVTWGNALSQRRRSSTVEIIKTLPPEYNWSKNCERARHAPCHGTNNDADAHCLSELHAVARNAVNRACAIQGTERPPRAPEIFTCIFRAFVIWQAGLWPPPDCC